MATRIRRRKSTTRARRVRRASSALSGGLKFAATIASATLQALIPKGAPAAKKRKPPKKAPVSKVAKVQKPATGRARPSSFRTGQHKCDQGARGYKIFKPGGAAGPSKAPPLLVMLHGCGQTPDDFAKGTRMNALAKEHGLIVVYPAQPRDAHMNRCWSWFHPGDQKRDAGEPAILASLTRKIIKTHGADPARVYIAGLSAGASMALIMAHEYPEIFAAVGVHSGLPAGAAHDQASAIMAMQRGNPGWRLNHPMPTIVFQGSRDAVVNPRNGRLVAIRAREPYTSLRGTETAGQVRDGRAWRKTVHKLGSGRALVEYWSVTASGHAWSGGSSAGGFTDPKGPDASREMIRFFLRHSLSARRRTALTKSLLLPQA